MSLRDRLRRWLGVSAIEIVVNDHAVAANYRQDDHGALIEGLRADLEAIAQAQAKGAALLGRAVAQLNENTAVITLWSQHSASLAQINEREKKRAARARAAAPSPPAPDTPPV